MSNLKKEAEEYWRNIKTNSNFILDCDRLVRISEEAILDKLTPDMESALIRAYNAGLEAAAEKTFQTAKRISSENINVNCCDELMGLISDLRALKRPELPGEKG